jgi:outer membrane lipoprotein-sorting protein
MATFHVFRTLGLAAGLAMGLVGGLGRLMVPASAAESKPAAKAFPDEPAAHALYNQMIEAMRKANSLSYVSHYKWEAKGMVHGDCIYRVWLKKPNFFRVETESTSLAVTLLYGKRGGILIGDGNTLWIHWPQGRPQMFGPEGSVKDKDDQQARLKSYMTKPAPLARHSIGHEVGILGAGMSMPILDPSTFHGYTDSLQPYLDGVKSLGTEKVGTEDCDKIEVSIMKGQRSWYLSLSQKDHLPRKLKQIVRVSYDIVMNEEWSSVTLNANIPETMFAWKPPADWKECRLPKPEERLLKPGAKAPDFELASADGGRIKLCGYRGQVVWFYIWRAG